MKKKWTPVPQDWWDPAAIEQWLEDEAKKGWRVASCNGWFAKFEKTEPKECRVRIQFQGPMEKKAWEERIDAYEELGWEFATAHGQDYEIFYCDDPAAPEPDTDEAVYAMAWKTPLRRSWWSGWAFLLLPLVVLIWMCSLEESLLRTLLRMKRVHWVNTPVYRYFVHAESAIHSGRAFIFLPLDHLTPLFLLRSI